jgi:hypothetical protein
MKKCSFEDKRSGVRSQLDATLSFKPRAETMETSMPSEKARSSAKLDALRREIAIGIEQAKAGRFSKLSIPEIARSISDETRRPVGALGVTYIALDFDEPCPSITALFEEGK